MTKILIDEDVVKLALEALEAGEYYIDDLEAIVYAADDIGVHEDRAKMQAAITALRKALADNALDKKAEDARQLGLDYEPAQKRPQNCGTGYCSCIECVMEPAQQEPVAWMTEEHYAEMHTSKWTPKIQQVFSKDGILESQTIQYAPQSKTVPYPPAQRTWVGLTTKEIREWWASENGLEDCLMAKLDDFEQVARAIEAKLKEKNT